MTRMTVLLAVFFLLLGGSSKADQVTYFTMAFSYGNQLSRSGEQDCIEAIQGFVASTRETSPVKITYEVYRGRIIQPERGDFDHRTQRFQVTRRNVYQRYEVESLVSGALTTKYGEVEVAASLSGAKRCRLRYEAELFF